MTRRCVASTRQDQKSVLGFWKLMCTRAFAMFLCVVWYAIFLLCYDMLCFLREGVEKTDIPYDCEMMAFDGNKYRILVSVSVDGRKPRCLKCGKPGHIRRDCKARHYASCREMTDEHITPNCPYKGSFAVKAKQDGVRWVSLPHNSRDRRLLVSIKEITVIHKEMQLTSPHILLRGKRLECQPLILPKFLIQTGLGNWLRTNGLIKVKANHRLLLDNRFHSLRPRV